MDATAHALYTLANGPCLREEGPHVFAGLLPLVVGVLALTLPYWYTPIFAISIK